MTIDYKDKFKEIGSFLKEYEYLHETEFIKKYPAPYPNEIQTWINELKEWSVEDIALLESYPSEELIQNLSLKKFLKKVKTLSSLTTFDVEEEDFPQRLKRKLNPKKLHEIQKIRGLVTQHIDCETIVDIGGGAGHLSSSLIFKTRLKSLCIDMDERLQASGRKRAEALFGVSDQLTFIPLKFFANSEMGVEFNPSTSLLIGLHSCGDLSSSLIKFGINKKINNILSFGCCYHKIKSDLNISAFSKAHGVRLTKSSLHLAARSGSIVTTSDILKRLKQKRYRYTLHYLLYSIEGCKFEGIGNATPSDYSASFYDYCIKFDSKGVLSHLDASEVEEFYSLSEDKVWSHYIADTIRLFLGRIIELYIVFDRALFLEEKGYKVNVHELFDRALSPRNIMIKATPLQ